MIEKKEFYFIRHGQTDHNISSINLKVDHPEDTPLNATGRRQAKEIEPLIASLPVKSICCSPLKRAQETQELIAGRLLVPKVDIINLGECTAKIWGALNSSSFANDPTETFLERVQKGLSEALLHPGPPLIVSHGGVHFAICHLLNISGHEWKIDNCTPVHFYTDENGKWVAEKIRLSGLS